MSDTKIETKSFFQNQKEVIGDFWSSAVQEQSELVGDFWSEFAEEQSLLIGNFWDPVIEEQSELLDHFWSPVIEEQSGIVGNFWEKTWNEWEPGLSRAADWYDTRVLDTLRIPAIYARNHFGEEIESIQNTVAGAFSGVASAYRSQTRIVGDYWRPVLEDQERLIDDYWKRETPFLHGVLKSASEGRALVRATPKIGLSMYVNWSLANIQDFFTQTKDKVIPQAVKNQVEYMSDTMIPSQDGASLGRAEASLYRMASHSKDMGMRECYHVQVLDSLEINAFNTGCTIYITQGALNELPNDGELDAVIAHEVSHGDAGHAMRNLGLELLLPIAHAGKIILDGAWWGWTGEISPRLSQVMSEGHLEVLLEDYAALAPPVEIEADQGATELLLRAGQSPDSLRKALIRLHGLDPDVVLEHEADIPEELGAGSEGKVRNYPGLSERLQAIDETERRFSYLKRR